MKVLLENLVLRGHEVTVLVPSSNLLIDYQDTSSPFTFEVLQVPYSQKDLDDIMDNFLNLWLNEASNLFIWELMWKIKEELEVFTKMSKQICDTLIADSQLVARLQQAKFDVLIADPLVVGGELVAEILRIPFVYSFRFSEANVVERLCGGLPSPPSYVPASTKGLTDRMSFGERLHNLLFYCYMDFFFLTFWRDHLDGYYSKVLGKAAAGWFLFLCSVLLSPNSLFQRHAEVVISPYSHGGCAFRFRTGLVQQTPVQFCSCSSGAPLEHRVLFFCQ